MEVDELIEISDESTPNYDESDFHSSAGMITQNNWSFLIQEIFESFNRMKFLTGARELIFLDRCQFETKENLNRTLYKFPLSSVDCSRLICQYASPLSSSNHYEFCGVKNFSTGWEISEDQIEFSSKFNETIRQMTFEQINLNIRFIDRYLDVVFKKIIIFGSCAQSKIYQFEDKMFFYLATILVFLPSSFDGGIYRFSNDINDKNDLDGRKIIFDHNKNDRTKPFILILPADCRHEIQPISKGFQCIAVYHLVSKSPSINDLLSLLMESETEISVDPPAQPVVRRLNNLLDYWFDHQDKMSAKLVIPLQHPSDYSSYFSLLFREKTLRILELIRRALKIDSRFFVYSAILQQDKNPNPKIDNRFFLCDLSLLNGSNENFSLKFDKEHERTIIFSEFLGDIDVYIDAFDQIDRSSTDGKFVRSVNQYQVVVLLPKISQWDLLLDDHSVAYHHLSFIISRTRFSEFIYDFCRCFLRDQTALISSFAPFVRCLNRLDYSENLTNVINNLLQIKKLRETFFHELDLSDQFVQLIDRFGHCSILSMSFFNFFRQLLNQWMPTKLKEICRILLNIERISIRTLLINAFIRFIFKPRLLSRHVHFETLCQLFNLFIVDGSYSADVQLIVARQIVKRVRKLSNDNEILCQGLKSHLIPMLIQIYRNQSKSNSEKYSFPIAFIFVYQYCLNALNSFCSSSYSFKTSITTDPISTNEAALICQCETCNLFREFLLGADTSSWIVDLTNSRTNIDCLSHTLKQYSALSTEYKYDPITGQQQTLVISKTAYEQEQKQLCFHLRRLLLQLEKI